MTTNFDSYLHPVSTEYKETVPGSQVNIQIYTGNIRPAIDAFLAKHNRAINDDTNNAGTVLSGYTHRGGRDVTTILVADNTEIVIGTTYLEVDGRRYNFVTAVTGGNQILKGTTANDTAINIQARLSNRDGYIATVSTATVTLKGLTSGSLSVATNNTAAFTVANASPIKSSLKEVYDGDLVIEKTQNIWELDVHIADANGELRPDTVRVITYTPTITNPITALATLVARIKAVRVHALLGTEPADFDANQEPITLGVVSSKNNASYPNIAAALQRVYGTDPNAAFVISGSKNNILTSTVQGANYASYVGNKLKARVGCESSLPTLKVAFTEDGFAYIEGRGTGEPAGSVDGYKHAKTGSSVTLNHSSNKQEFGTTKTRTVELVTWKANQVYNADLQKVAAGDNNIARSGIYDFLMTGGDSFTCGLIVSIVDNLGNQHYEVFYEGLLTKGVETEFTVESAAGINFEYKPLPKSGVADTTGFTGIRTKKTLPSYA